MCIRDSAEAVYSSHFLEHLELEEARHVLVEAARVLRPGGRIRLVVPDLEAIVANYARNREQEPSKAALQFRHDTGFFAVPPPKSFRDFLRYRVTRRHDHQVLHDEPLLRAELEEVGFTEVERRACGESGIAGIESVDWPDRFENALCLEALKP